MFGLSVGQRSRKEGGVVFVFEDVFFIRGGRGGGLLVWRRSRLGGRGKPPTFTLDFESSPAVEQNRID